MSNWFSGLFRTQRRVVFNLGPVQSFLYPVEVVMGQSLKDSQGIKLKASEVDAAGNPVAPGSTSPGGGFTFTSSDPTIVKILTDAQGAVWAVAAGPVGSADVTATDPSGLSGVLHFDVSPDVAVSVAVDVDGPAVDKSTIVSAAAT